MRRTISWLTGAVVVLAGAAAYLEFVDDIRTPYSLLTMRAGFATHNKLPPETLAAATAALKAKFGAATEVWQGPAGIIGRLNGQIVATEPAHTFFHEALGVTKIPDADGKVSTFPFDIGPDMLRTSIPPNVLPILKMEVELALPGDDLDFSANDFSIER